MKQNEWINEAVIHSFRGGMQIQVKLPTGKTRQMDCDLGAKFSNLKKKISELCSSIQYDQLVILYRNKPLEEEKTLQELGVQAESVFEVLSIRSLIERYENKLNELTGDPDSMMQSGSQKTQVQQIPYKDLEIQLNQKEQLIQSYKNQIQAQIGGEKGDTFLTERLQKKNMMLEKEASESSQKINELFSEKLQLARDIEDIKADFQMQLQQKEFEVEAYSQQVQSRHSLVDKVHDEMKAIKKQLMEKENECEKYRDQYQEIMYEDKLTKNELQQLKTQLNDLKKQQINSPGINKVEQKPFVQEQNEFNRIIQEQKTKYEIAAVQIEGLQNKLVQFKNQIQQQNEKIDTCEFFIQNLKDQLEVTEKALAQKEKDFAHHQQVSQQNQKKLEQDKARLQQEIQQSANNFSDLEAQKNKLQLQLNRTLQELDETKASITHFQKKETSLAKELNEEKNEKNQIQEQNDSQVLKIKRENESLKGKNQQYQLQLDQLELEKQKLKKVNFCNINLIQNLSQEQQKLERVIAESEDQSKCWNEMEQKMSSQLKALQVKKEALARILVQKKSSALKNKLAEGIQGPMEALFKSSVEISKFLDDPNVVTDICQYKLSLIKMNEEPFDKKLNVLSDLNFDDAYSLQYINTISVIRSVQPNAEGDRQQVFLIKVQEEPKNEFQNQIFAIKHFKDTPNFTDAKTACRSVTGNLIAKFLMYKFVTLLKKHMKEKIPEPKYPDLFLLEGGPEAENRIYICEKVSEGKFSQFNGAGKFRETGQLAEFCNAFSYFTYFYSQRQVLVSYVQGADLNLYDPVVSTEDGILDDNDYGYDEISSFLHAMKSGDPKLMGRKFLGALNIKVT